jgi:drug/metabolite transporter (DMT)-like permease
VKKTLFFSGPLLIVIAAALWAVDGVVRRSLYSLSPLVIVFFEHFIGALILAPLVIRMFKKEALTRYEWMALGGVALFSGLLGTLWFTTALLMTNYISFSVVFLLQKLQPLFAIIAARVVLKEKIQSKYIVWACIALGAAFFITFPKGVVNLHTGDKTFLAALYALGAAAAWGGSTAFSRYALIKHNDMFITGLRFWATTVLAGVALSFLGLQPKLATITWAQFGQFTFIAFSTGMVALLIYYKGLKTTPVSVSTILELTFPLLAVMIDIIFYKTVMSPVQIVAAAALLYAMYQVSRLQKI